MYLIDDCDAGSMQDQHTLAFLKFFWAPSAFLPVYQFDKPQGHNPSPSLSYYAAVYLH